MKEEKALLKVLFFIAYSRRKEVYCLFYTFLFRIFMLYFNVIFWREYTYL